MANRTCLLDWRKDFEQRQAASAQREADHQAMLAQHRHIASDEELKETLEEIEDQDI